MEHGVRARLRGGDVTDVLIGSSAALVIYASLAAFALLYHQGALFSLCLLSVVAGSAVGWAIGIGLSPYNREERTSFVGIGKLVYGFLAGYIISKIDPLLVKLVSNWSWTGEESSVALVLLIVGLTSLVTSLAITYVSRSYWAG